MASAVIGVDLRQNPLRVGGCVLRNYIVQKGSKGTNLSFDQAPSEEELVQCFNDVSQIVKSYFGTSGIKDAVLGVPNHYNNDVYYAIESAARRAWLNVKEVISEYMAVAAGYTEKARPTAPMKIAIVSVSDGVLQIDVVTCEPVNPNTGEYVFIHNAQKVHREPSNAEEEKSKHSGGILTGIGSTILATASQANAAIEASPITQLIEHQVNEFLRKGKLADGAPVQKVIFVGKAASSPELKQAVMKEFDKAEEWSAGDENEG